MNIIFIISVLTCFSQISSLTKKQMYQDFDQLVKIIEDGNPQLEVRKIVTGFHQLDTIKSLRKNIDTITNNDNFNALLNRVLFYCLDAHTYETNTYFSNYDNLKDIDTLAIIANAIYKDSVRNLPENIKKRQLKDIEKFQLSVYSFDNQYYFIGDYNLISKNKDTLHINIMRLISYNGEEVGKYIERNCEDDLRYDFLRQKYYYGTWGFKFPRQGTLKGYQDGKFIEINLADYPVAIMGSFVKKQYYEILFNEIPQIEYKIDLYEKIVEFFEKDSILYIYIDKMDKYEDLCNKIKDVGNGKRINKIVIDVRGNGGGSDMVWLKTLSAIIKDTLDWYVKLAYNDTKLIKEKFKGYHPIDKKEPIKWLNNKIFGIIEAIIKIEPDDNSLKYDGKIYLLSDRNTYSSAHSLVNFAEQSEQIVSIGTPTGRLVGFGIGPQIFQLKNSKFTFRMPCVIDITDCNKVADAYKDFHEVLVKPDFQEVMIYHIALSPQNKAYNLKSEIYLRRHDTWFQKVLEME